MERNHDNKRREKKSSSPVENKGKTDYKKKSSSYESFKESKGSSESKGKTDYRKKKFSNSSFKENNDFRKNSDRRSDDRSSDRPRRDNDDRRSDRPRRDSGRSDNRRSSSEGNVKHKAICGGCGAQCEVPFVPKGDKPVLCSRCYNLGQGNDAKFNHRAPKTRSGVPMSMFPGRRDSKDTGSRGRGTEAELKEINRKLDIILQAMGLREH